MLRVEKEAADQSQDVIMEGEVIQQPSSAQNLYVIVTSTSIQVFNEVWALQQQLDGQFSHTICLKDTLVVSKNDQLTIYNHQLQPVLCRTLTAPVSCLCANEQMNSLYVCLYDSPFYSLNILSA